MILIDKISKANNTLIDLASELVNPITQLDLSFFL